MMIGGTLWSVAFLYAWIPVEGVFSSASAMFGDIAAQSVCAMHFFFVLCLYDSMLTYVEVNHGALLAELTQDSSVRASCTAFSSVAAAIGSISSYIAYEAWNLTDLRAFRLVCVTIAALCIAVFLLSTTSLHDYEAVMKCSTSINSPKFSVRSVLRKYVNFLSTLPRQRNFAVFALLSTIQQFDCTFEKNFFSMSLDVMVGSAMSRTTRGMLICLSFLLPQLMAAVLSLQVKKAGLYGVVRSVLLIRVGVLLVGALLGRAHAVTIAAVRNCLLLLSIASHVSLSIDHSRQPVCFRVYLPPLSNGMCNVCCSVCSSLMCWVCR